MQLVSRVGVCETGQPWPTLAQPSPNPDTDKAITAPLNQLWLAQCNGKVRSSELPAAVAASSSALELDIVDTLPPASSSAVTSTD